MSLVISVEDRAPQFDPHTFGRRRRERNRSLRSAFFGDGEVVVSETHFSRFKANFRSGNASMVECMYRLEFFVSQITASGADLLYFLG